MDNSGKARTGGCFSDSRVNRSTLLVVENDSFEEHPFIYVKVCDSAGVIVVSDTGCGGKGHDTIVEFLEHRLATFNFQKLRDSGRVDDGAEYEYLIICTHCHYDHILGIPSFKERKHTILASSYDKSFIEVNLDQHSLCQDLGISAPEYNIDHWSDDGERVSYMGKSLGLQILHTPGHTPDELAWYDEEERHLYVGDSFYERVAEDGSYSQAIIFPNEGNIIVYMQSLHKLLDFVGARNAEKHSQRLKIGCGHVTSSVDGEEILLAVMEFMLKLLSGGIPIKEKTERRGEECGLWQEDGEPRFSLRAPLRLVVEARRQSIS
ncbi:hypothetical protein MMC09_004802 [Bachmanniomyces sp. S44760]|nr:hypothetical protein [Bachmanniomyces sp. S44760]